MSNILVRRKFDPAANYSNLVELAQQRARWQPRRKAYIFLKNGETETASLSFGELDRRARAIAVRLGQYFQPGDRVLLTQLQGPEFIVAFFGCLYAGLVAVPVYPPLSSTDVSRLTKIAADAGAAGLCLGRDGFNSAQLGLSNPLLGQRLRCLTLTDGAEGSDGSDLGNGSGAIEDLAAQWVAPRLEPGSLALLQYTTGAANGVKGVMVSHANLLHNQRLIERSFAHTARTVGVGWLPLHHDMGLIGNLLQPLYLGCTSVLMSPAAFLAKPLRWLQAISTYRASTSGGPNFAYELCIRRVRAEQLPGLDLSRWQVAFNGAEPVLPGTLARFAQKFAICGFRPQAFRACYGLAEATLLVSAAAKAQAPRMLAVDVDELRHHRVHPATATTHHQREVASCGTPALQQALIVDPVTCRPCPVDRVGEVWLRGDSVAAGYWNQPERSQATFGAHLAGSDDGPDHRPDGGPFLRTGDLGFMHGGELYITGRLFDLMHIRGRHYYPQDIETTVRASHPVLNWGAAAAILVRSKKRVNQLIVMQEVERDQLRRIPRTQVLDAARGALLEKNGLKLNSIVFVQPGSLPRTSSGKIRRDACTVTT